MLDLLLLDLWDYGSQGFERDPSNLYCFVLEELYGLYGDIDGQGCGEWFVETW